MLLVTTSKNVLKDVRAAFDAHPDWPLKYADFVLHKVSWDPKSQSIADAMLELNLSKFSDVVFLDDNPVEIGEVSSHCAGIHAMNVPAASRAEDEALEAYCAQLWPLDIFKTTREDNIREENLLADKGRALDRDAAKTFGEYIESLKVEVLIAPPADTKEQERVVQLSVRTNQFNFVGEAGRLAGFPTAPLEVLVAHVKDRYGDYGLVGVMIFEEVKEVELRLHNFMMR